MTPSHWDRWFHFLAREPYHSPVPTSTSTSSTLPHLQQDFDLVCLDAARATLLLLNIILDNDNLNRNLPQLQWYFMRNQQRHSATVGEGINIKLGHNTTSNRRGATSQHFLVAQRSGQWCWWFWLVNVSLCLEGLGTGEIGKFCLKLNFYQV